MTTARPTSDEEFEEFFERHYRELGRLAYLLTGDRGAADDLSGDVFLATWKQWERVRDRDQPLAYVRRIMINMASSRVRRLVRERHQLTLLQVDAEPVTAGPDGAAVIDVRTALQALPVRRRTCVVLRHAFDLSEQEVAATLGISVGTVKSQTSKGVAQLQALLAAGPPTTGGPAGGAAPSAWAADPPGDLARQANSGRCRPDRGRTPPPTSGVGWRVSRRLRSALGGFGLAGAPRPLSAPARTLGPAGVEARLLREGWAG